VRRLIQRGEIYGAPISRSARTVPQHPNADLEIGAPAANPM
jgi:hypothetical protein